MVFLLCGVLLTIRRTLRNAGLGFNLTRAALRQRMNGRDCISVDGRCRRRPLGFLRRGLRAVSFVSLQLRRGLAAVRRESLLSSALIAETARGGTCGRHNKSAFLKGGGGRVYVAHEPNRVFS